MPRILWLLTLLALSGWANEQQQLDQFAAQLQIRYQVLDNLDNSQCETAVADGHCFGAELQLRTGEAVLAPPWTLYFSHIAPIQWVGHADFAIEHINGDLHRLTTNKPLRPNSQYLIPLRAAFWHASRSDLMPNYYVVKQGLQPRVIASTQDLHSEQGFSYAGQAGDFSQPAQYRRAKQDQLALADANWLYTHYQQAQPTVVVEQTQLTPLPQVQKLQWLNGHTELAHLRLPNAEKPNSWALATMALHSQGLTLDRHGAPVALKFNPSMAAEHYRLNVDHSGIQIDAADWAAANYALISLAQLYEPESARLPWVNIEDGPRYGFRGLHLDIARNFLGVETIKAVLQQMAWLKLNRLHLHLADDEGWRLQIPALPELTEIGAYRCHDLSEQQCLLPQLGSGPARQAPVNGFLSVAEFIEILQLAKRLHIQVLPSLDMPGHARAAVVAMRARQRRLIANGRADAAAKYSLLDAEDRSQYLSVQYYRDNTLNPCIASTYRFVETVLDTLVSLYQEAGAELSHYHVGGDETAGAWDESPACQALLASTPELSNSEDLLGYFLRKVAQLSQRRGLTLAGWSDGMQTLLGHAGRRQVNIWQPLFWQGDTATHNFINAGWDTVLSLPDALYFDFPYRNHPHEPGYYWGAKNTDSLKVFQLMPDNLPAHAALWEDRWGQPYRSMDELARQDAIVGIQAQLWGETVRSRASLDYMLYPRLFAAAERAWHQPTWAWPYRPGHTYGPQKLPLGSEFAKDWHRFGGNLVARELPRLQRLGYGFRLPPPGAARTQSGILAQTPLLGLEIEVSRDGKQWSRYVAPFKSEQPLLLRSRLGDSVSAATRSR